MSITSHEAFKEELKALLRRRLKQFPFYFYGNITINLFLVIAFILATVLLVSDFLMQSGIAVYGLIFMSLLISIFPITLRGLRRNIHIFHALRSGHDILDFREYEMDHALNFINQLPKDRSEIERMKVSLSFGKLIALFELLEIIHCDNKVCDLEPLLKLKKAAAIASEEEAKKIAAAKNK